MGLLPGWWLGEEDERADEPYVQPDGWDRELRAAGFSGLDDCILDVPRPHQLQAHMISSPAIYEVVPKPIALIFDDSSQQAVKDLQIELSQTGWFETVLQQLDTEAELPKGDIICLLDVSKPFFMDIEASRFGMIRRLMAQISESKDGVLWLTLSSQLSCQDPRWGQTPGAMRTIRKEMEIDVAICEIDPLDNSCWKTVTQIARKFSLRHISSHDPELEYAIDHGRVYVPRMYPICVNKELRKAVTFSSTDEEVELDLTLGAVGRLDTLQWVTRSCQKPKDSQVAVEIMATGLNFRVRLKNPDTC